MVKHEISIFYIPCQKIYFIHACFGSTCADLYHMYSPDRRIDLEPKLLDDTFGILSFHICNI